MGRRAPLVETRPSPGERTRGLLSDRASGQRVEACTHAPDADLRDVVQDFWTGRWDLRGQPPHTSVLLGDPSIHIVFEAGGAHGGSRIVGVWTRVWRRVLEDQGLVRGVKLRPGAARVFLPTAATVFTNRIVPLRDVFGDEVLALEDAVLRPGGDQEAFAAFADWLRKKRRLAPDNEPSLAIALVARVVADSEITTVERLAQVAGVHRRILQRLFREHVGATPKQVIRRNRLQEIAKRMEQGLAPSLAALAADLGYADQAHLARDFKSVVGSSPSAFAARFAKPA